MDILKFLKDNFGDNLKRDELDFEIAYSVFLDQNPALFISYYPKSNVVYFRNAMLKRIPIAEFLDLLDDSDLEKKFLFNLDLFI